MADVVRRKGRGERGRSEWGKKLAKGDRSLGKEMEKKPFIPRSGGGREFLPQHFFHVQYTSSYLPAPLLFFFSLFLALVFFHSCVLCSLDRILFHLPPSLGLPFLF